MTTLGKTRSRSAIFLEKLGNDYPQFCFKAGKQEYWSPKTNTITFNPKRKFAELSYSVLHELAHALLEHKNYQSDFELLKMEAEAWELAAMTGKKYGVKIDYEHIQNCLDTYRDWLHRRSTCPTCGMHVLQSDISTYRCFNCQTAWKVSAGRFVRPYRKKTVDGR